MKFLLFILLILSLQTHADSFTATREELKTELRKELPKNLCLDDEYFKQCFNVTTANCKSQMTTFTENCFVKLKRMPASVDIADESAKWGYQVGRCVGLEFEKKMKDQKKDSSKCASPQSWLY